jgi:hypothetical protein
MLHQKRTLIVGATPLGRIPYLWIRYVEPKILRDGRGTCWLWSGAPDSDGYPVMRIGARLVSVRRFVAKLFWELPHRARISTSCGHRDCLNPRHFRFRLLDIKMR